MRMGSEEFKEYAKTIRDKATQCKKYKKGWAASMRKLKS